MASSIYSCGTDLAQYRPNYSYDIVKIVAKYNIKTNFLQTIQIHKSIPQLWLEKLKNSNLTQVSRSADIKIKVIKIYK